jgi:hypothetical protein
LWRKITDSLDNRLCHWKYGINKLAVLSIAQNFLRHYVAYTTPHLRMKLLLISWLFIDKLSVGEMADNEMSVGKTSLVFRRVGCGCNGDGFRQGC